MDEDSYTRRTDDTIEMISQYNKNFSNRNVYLSGCRSSYPFSSNGFYYTKTLVEYSGLHNGFRIGLVSEKGKLCYLNYNKSANGVMYT